MHRCAVSITLRGDEAKRSLTNHGGGCGAEKCDEGEDGDLADERSHRLEHQHCVHVQVLQCMREFQGTQGQHGSVDLIFFRKNGIRSNNQEQVS